MPLHAEFVRAVVFIIGDGHDENTQRMVRKPVGTGFLVAIPSWTRPERDWPTYLVTAAHVITGQPNTEVRLRGRRQERYDVSFPVIDLPVSNWIVHDTEDIALTPFHPIDDEQPAVIALQGFDNPERRRITSSLELGDPVVFLGMLSGVPEMNRRAIPLVRSGTIAALYQRVPVSADGRETEAHLIDCRSYNGFSGAPCFMHSTMVNPRDDFGGLVGVRTEFMGMLVAHYDEAAKRPGIPVIKLNIGIGIVLPAERIYEVLKSEILSAMRDAAVPETPRKATMDSDGAGAV